MMFFWPGVAWWAALTLLGMLLFILITWWLDP